MEKIALDLDGTLYRWHEAVYNERVVYHNETRPYLQWAVEFWDENYHSTLFWENLLSFEHLYSQMPPTSGLVNFLHKLSSSFTIYYLTHRKEIVRITTENYLRRYNFPQTENLVLTEADKSLFVRGMNIDIVVDDWLQKVESCIPYSDVYIIKQPWNLKFGNRKDVTWLNSVLDLENYVQV